MFKKGFTMMDGKASNGYKWNTWLAIWASPIISILIVILYILILDQDIPSLKPRPTLENAAACMVYVANIGNVIAAVILAGILLQEEYNLLLAWLCFSLVQITMTIILVVLSFYTLLKAKPARIGLHVVCGLASAWAFFTILRIYKYRDSPSYDWQDGVSSVRNSFRRKKSSQQQPEDLKGEVNDISGTESGVL